MITLELLKIFKLSWAHFKAETSELIFKEFEYISINTLKSKIVKNRSYLGFDNTHVIV